MPNLTPIGRLGAALAALALVASGCASPATPSPEPSTSAVTIVVTPAPSPSPVPTWSPSPDVSPGLPSDSPSPSPSVSPSDSPSPTATPPPFSGRAVATRVVIPALEIDLAVVKSPPRLVYPYCNVAMYLGSPLGQPGEHRATYLFAHARDGMFGPIWRLAIVKGTPSKMVGMLVDVYTSDSKVHTYRIAKVLLHQRTLTTAINARTDQLWLQTSEGPNHTYPKTQVVANPVSVAPTDYAASHPKVHIVRCV